MSLKLKFDQGVDPAKLSERDMSEASDSEASWRWEGMTIEAAYDRPNDQNAYTTVEPQMCR